MNEKLKFCKLLGTNINVITMDETVDYMDQHLDELRGKYICVSNVHTTVMAFRDAEYRKVQNGSAMNLPEHFCVSAMILYVGCADIRRQDVFLDRI